MAEWMLWKNGYSFGSHLLLPDSVKFDLVSHRRLTNWQMACPEKLRKFHIVTFSSHCVFFLLSKYLARTWQHGLHHLFPKMDVFQKLLIQIILAAKWLVCHSSKSPNQQRRPLPFLLFDSYSMMWCKELLRCVGEGDAEAAAALPQRRVRLLLRQPELPRGNNEAVCHQGT